MFNGVSPRVDRAILLAQEETDLWMLVGRDVNGMDIFRPYSNSIRSGKIFIRPYSISSI